MRGRVVSVSEKFYGTELAAAASGGASTITVVDTVDLDTAGKLLIDNEVVTYLSIDETTNVVTLSGTLGSAHAEEAPVLVYPRSLERWAVIDASPEHPDSGEGVLARVPYALWDKLPAGIRTDPMSAETVEAEFVGDELVVMDVTGRAPAIDASFLSSFTPEVTSALVSDGSPPSISPECMVKGGVNFLVVQWSGVSNADPVTYEVHLSQSSGFTPSGGTLSGEVRGTMFFARNMPDGSPLAYGVTYYARIVAKDIDGSAAAGVEGSGMLNKDAGGDIIVGAVTAERLEAMLILATSLVAGQMDGARVELGVSEHDDEQMIGLHAFGSDGTTLTFMIDATTGDVLVRGQVDFGTDSSLLSNDDVIELAEQTPSGFQSSHRVQSQGYSNGAGGNSSWAIGWPSRTQGGNTLIVSFALFRNNVSAPGTIATPSGWTLLQTDLQDVGTYQLRLYTFKKENAAAENATALFVRTGNVDRQIHMGVELSGLDTQDTLGGALDTASLIDTLPEGTDTVVPSTGGATGFADDAIIVVEAWVDSGSFTHPTGYDLDFATSAADQLTLSVFRKDETTTGVKTASHDITRAAPLSGTVPYIAHTVAFKRKAATGEAPAGEDGKIRIYARPVGTRELLTVVDSDGVRSHLAGQLRTRLRRVAAQSLTNNAWTTLSWDTQDYDIGDLWSSGTNIVIPIAGTYHVSCGGATASGATGRLGIKVFVNGAGVAIRNMMAKVTSASDTVNASGDLQLAASDVVTILMFQDSGGAVNTDTGAETQPMVSIHQVA